MTGSPSGERATRPVETEYPSFYGNYVRKVGDGDIVRSMREQVRETTGFLRGIPESRAGHRYEPGKWSIREVVGHVCDSERVFSYRAVRIARGDTTPLPGFDEKDFVARSSLDKRSLDSLVDELEAIRGSTVALFDSLFPEEWSRRGTASGREITVRALAWVIAGHERHHMEVLRTRYLG